MEQVDFKDLATRLNGGQPPRVRSLLVTVIGELAPQPGAELSGQTVGRVMALIGVKPEATRVALHRLRKDGWIQSRKSGRTSAYALTPTGRAETHAAAPRIYAETSLAASAWLVVRDVGEPVGAQTEPGVWITGHIRLTGEPPSDAGALIVELTPSMPLPDWMRARICAPDLAEQSRQLAEELETLEAWLTDRPAPDAFHRDVLRVLVVHSWRRIALKAPILPDDLFPAPWAGAACRQRMTRIRRLMS